MEVNLRNDHNKGFLLGIITILCFIILTLGKSTMSLKKHVETGVEVVTSLNDTLKVYKRKDSSQVATISLLRTNSTKDFINMQTKDNEIRRLQNLVKEYKNKIPKGGSATIATTETTVTEVAPTIIYNRDTIRIDSLVYIYPEYKSNINLGKWVTGNVKSNKDSTSLNLLIENEFDIIIGEDGDFFTWKKKPFVELVNHNPYTRTKVLRSYQVSNPIRRRTGIGFFAGYGMILDVKAEIKPVIGVAIQYNLLEF